MEKKASGREIENSWIIPTKIDFSLCDSRFLHKDIPKRNSCSDGMRAGDGSARRPATR